jgi:hypothetical protein
MEKGEGGEVKGAVAQEALNPPFLMAPCFGLFRAVVTVLFRSYSIYWLKLETVSPFILHSTTMETKRSLVSGHSLITAPCSQRL